MAADPSTAPGGFRHLALLCQGPADYLSAVLGLVRDALARAEPVLLAVAEPEAYQLRRELGDAPAGIEFADMAELGRNPARIVSTLLAFTAEHTGQRVCCLTEPAWPSRSPAEVREVARNEALINVALAGVRATIVCCYDIGQLRPSVIAGARRTHPAIISRGAQRDSAAYLRSTHGANRWDRPLGPPPRRATSVTYHTDLAPVRAFAAREATRAGLGRHRTGDLVLSVSEVAANTLRHTGQPGTVLAWRSGGEFLCQVEDHGQITDPLAGLRPPAADQLGGQGLWVVNRVCDLVELRTGRDGTTVRLHMRLDGPDSTPGDGIGSRLAGHL